MTRETKSGGSEHIDFDRTDDSDLVSVVIPAYNAETFIGKTLLSVIGQSYRNLEIIVVDDGSDDGTVSIVEELARRDHRIRLITQENAGVGPARNRAIANSQGRLIAPVDADDLWHPDKLALQVEALRTAPPTVTVAYCWWVPIDEHDIVKSNGRIPFYCELEGDVFSELAVQNFIGNGSVPLIRRSALHEVGGYDTDRVLQACADWKLYLQLAERGEFALVKQVLVGYRQFSRSMSTAPGPMERSWNATIQWVRERHPRLSPGTIRRQNFHEYAYLFVLALKRRAFRSALRYMIMAAANGPGRFSCMALDLLGTKVRPLIEGRSGESVPFLQTMARAPCSARDLHNFEGLVQR
jgi:glycosyltransferase involved in cell wall biosynthesis